MWSVVRSARLVMYTMNTSYIPAAHVRHVSSTLPWPLGAYFLPNFKRQKTHVVGRLEPDQVWKSIFPLTMM